MLSHLQVADQKWDIWTIIYYFIDFLTFASFGKKLVNTTKLRLSCKPFQVAPPDAWTLVYSSSSWEVSTSVWLFTYSAVWRSPRELVVVAEAQEVVTEGGAWRTVAVKPATTQASVVVIDAHLFKLLVSAALFCPLFRLKYILLTSFLLRVWLASLMFLQCVCS